MLSVSSVAKPLRVLRGELIFLLTYDDIFLRALRVLRGELILLLISVFSVAKR